MKKRGALHIFIFLVIISAVSAVDHYVSPSGSASWSSCINTNTPCSLSTANSNAQAGDTVNMRGGTYNSAIAPARSGTSHTNRITYTNYNDEVVTFSGVSLLWNLDNRDWITISGSANQHIVWTNSFLRTEGDDMDNCIFSYLTFENAAGIGSWGGFEIGTDSSQNWIHHINFGDNGDGDPDYDNHVISCGTHVLGTETYGNVIEDSILYHGGHNALQVRARYSVIRNNVITNKDVYRPAASISKAGSDEYEGWHLWEGNRIAFAVKPSSSFVCLFQTNSNDGIYRKNMFYDLIDSPSFSLNVYSADASNPTPNDQYIYNNDFLNSGAPYRYTSIYISDWSDGGDIEGIVIVNNIFEDTEGGVDVKTDGTVSIAREAGNFYTNDGDPKFTSEITFDEHSRAQPDFNLQSNSPCIDAATHLTLTNGAGSGTSLRVDDAHYFFSGDGAPWYVPSYTGITGDYIFVDGWSSPVEIASINYDTNTITLVSSRTWPDNAKVYLAVTPNMGYYGNGPDIGAFEYVSSTGCTEDWQCSDWSSWSACINDLQTRSRECNDANSCGTIINRPAESETQSCSVLAKSYTVLKINSPPAIDGNLGEYADANTITITNSAGNTANYRMLWNSEALHISAEVADDQLGAIIYTRDGSDIWNDDSIELFFDPLNNDLNYLNSDDYKFFVNLLNIQYDRFYGSDPWDADFSSAITKNGSLNIENDADSGYTIEIAIPWAEWTGVPSEGDVWGFDVNMNDRRDDGTRVWKAWSQTSGLNKPEEFGEIVFSSEAVGSRCGDADILRDGTVDINDLINYINRWKDGAVRISDIMAAIGEWKNGCQ